MITLLAAIGLACLAFTLVTTVDYLFLWLLEFTGSAYSVRTLVYVLAACFLAIVALFDLILTGAIQ